MTRAEFMTVMAYVGSAIGKPLSLDALEVYFDLLGDLKLESLQVAARRVLLEHPWNTFPSVAELREAAVASARGEVAGISPAKAWSIAWDVVRDIDPEVPGSFNRACDKHSAPPMVVEAIESFGLLDLCFGHEPVAVLRGQFLKTFEQLAASEHRAAIMPAKVLEAITGNGVRAVAIGDVFKPVE